MAVFEELNVEEFGNVDSEEFYEEVEYDEESEITDYNRESVL